MISYRIDDHRASNGNVLQGKKAGTDGNALAVIESQLVGSWVTGDIQRRYYATTVTVQAFPLFTEARKWADS